MVRGLAHEAMQVTSPVTIMIFRHSFRLTVWIGILYHKQTALFYQQNWQNYMYVHCMTLLAAVITWV